MKKNILTILPIVLLPFFSFAAGVEHASHHEIEIPVKTVMWQLINLTILFVGLVYFLKDHVVSFFKLRQEEYIQASRKSAAAREEAEKSFLDIKHKLEQLEANKTESLARAQAEAAEMKNAMIQEAAQLAKRIKEDADQIIQAEIGKAQRQLREQLVNESVSAARMVLTKDIGQADQAKLQSEFVNHI